MILDGTDVNTDYKILSKMPNLSVGDRKIVQQQLVKIPPRRKAAQEEEMGEMMGKLKGVSTTAVPSPFTKLTRPFGQLGNSILKPFGLSTHNFNMVKDEKSGGYSMNFNQGGSS